ncbi:MAG: C45 family peptidase [Gemmataceae bacterium]
MRRFAGSVLLVLIGGAVFAQAPTKFVEAKHKGGELKYVQGMPLLTVRGTPAEIGEQYGILAVKNAPGPELMLKQFLTDLKLDKRYGFLKFMANRMKPAFPPDHLTEITAAAQASGKDLDMALFANTLYDLTTTFGCATVVVEKGRSETGQPIFGRNFDWFPARGIIDHTMIAVYHPTGKRSFATITTTPVTGCISGMNDAGLSVTLNQINLNEVKTKPKLNWEGTPTMLAYRRVLEECGTVAEAEKLLRGMKRATTACMTICDKDGGAVFEITPDQVERRTAVNDVCLCTNHLRTAPLSIGDKCSRYDRLCDAQKSDRKLGVADVFTELDRVNQGKATLQTMVFEPSARRLHLKMGDRKEPATKFEAKTFDLGKLFDAK